MKENPTFTVTECFPRITLWLLAVVTLFLVERQQAAGQTLLSYNLSQANANGESPGGPWTFASSFVVGQQSLNVTLLVIGGFATLLFRQTYSAGMTRFLRIRTVEN